uniref:Uncharacterized protein n=1 Tax=viral metagenome TaxID=1070528 RepID=A0A6M3J7H1_9ZZZZ
MAKKNGVTDTPANENQGSVQGSGSNWNPKQVEKLKKELEKQFSGTKVDISNLFKKIKEVSPDTDTDIILASRLGVSILTVDDHFISYYGDLVINDINELEPKEKKPSKEYEKGYKDAKKDCVKIINDRLIKNL